MTLLARLLETAGVDAPLVAPLSRYGERVLEANRSFNLTGAKTPEELAPHLVDSLTIVPFARDPHVDVGSGAGLPAIPLAIATGAHVTLIETTRKKAQFLQSLLEDLTLRGDVVAERAEIAAHDERLRDRFASGTARAVASAPTVAELLLPFVGPGGVAILQRGTIDARERAALQDAVLVLGGVFEEERQLDGDRRIVLLRKTGPTPPRFPRRTGIPQKRPLCS
ncbi:MAG: 16S rRNA (guanine(527)-N(7))-methyltransferase RsmG [Candidatus Eremiobacteraeota bacterium]|nr:16S rRNA (guanine(527)-N(7))-methyltransferase RsmG [Candidatus Eremiobacteraeota bacterium]